MRYPPHILDEIRARLPVSTVIGRKVRLKKAGREWRGLSPFNAEKTPSFYANDQKGFYHCFSSGKHGDIFTFLMETEGLPFPEAVERLAAEAGVDLPKLTPEAQQAVEKRRDLYDVLELACSYFENQLTRTKAAPAQAYLQQRGISLEIQREFRLGVAPDDRTQLFDYLQSKGVEKDLMIRAGLVIEPDDGRSIYDRFRGRIIIPIQDLRGRVVAFGGRALDKDRQPKYLNSPETEVFKKGEIVFNAHRARPAAHETGSAIVVEGYLDAISVFQAGIKAVVATLGTAFTEEQIAALWRLAPEPIICFDGDRAGRSAAFRAVDRIVPAIKTGFTFKFAFLPEGQDPDDLVRDAGVEAFRRLLSDAKSFWDVIWIREIEAAHLESENGQAVFEKRIKDIVSQISDSTLRRRYELTARLQVNDYLWKVNKKNYVSRLTGRETHFPLPNTNTSESIRLIGIERVFLGMCVHYPDLLERHRERIATMTFRGRHKDTAFSNFVSDLMRILDEYEVYNFKNFYNWMHEGFFETLNHLHGRQFVFKGRDLPWGHNLFARFPLLQHSIPERFIEECFDNFLELLWLRDLEDEMKHAVDTMPSEPTEGYELWVLHLQRDILAMRERVLNQEALLAEEATAYRSAAARFGLVAPNPRGMIEDDSRDVIDVTEEAV